MDHIYDKMPIVSFLNSMSDIVTKENKISVHTLNNIVSLYTVEFYKNSISLRDKTEAEADLVRTIASVSK